MAKIITLTIDPVNGDSKIETDGYQGHGCEAVHAAFERVLGTTTESVRKPEYNKIPEKKVNIIR